MNSYINMLVRKKKKKTDGEGHNKQDNMKKQS